MPRVETRSKEFVSANILKATVGTNGPRGGDSGHRGRTYFKLKDEASSDLRVSVNGQYYEEVDSLEIILGGDTELETFIDSLEFAVKTLKEQSAENNGDITRDSVDIE
ncbi:hypothetical protein [Virgibacillus sediminis]|uniref:Uncharacterized protein n=1 Tax=Virgibacillus sediminis TaxID=202260 RepID=A0ABV7A6I3_9BACI